MILADYAHLPPRQAQDFCAANGSPRKNIAPLDENQPTG